MTRVAALLAALVMLALAAWPHATPDVHAQDATFAVEGRVVNGTLDVGAAQLEVMLHTVTELARADTPTLTDDEGAFRFDDVPLNPQAAYGVSVVYQGALYGTDLDTSDGSPAPVTLTIYESTHDDSGIRAALASVLFASANREEQTISTLEIVRIINEANTTYVPGPEPMNLMRFGLPPNASELQVDTSLPDADYAQVDRGFALLASVPPGEHEVFYSYTFPYSGGGADYAKNLLYGAEKLRVLAPRGELSLTADVLGEPDEVVIGERPYQVIEASDLPRGERVSVRLSELPSLTAAESARRWADNVSPEAGALGVLGVVIVCALAVVVLRRRRAARPAPDAPAAEDAPAALDGDDGEMSVFAEIVTLRQMLADLDDARERGALSEGDYRRRRQLLQARLDVLERDS